jgi:uncharacterized protein (TIGR01777 family)
MSPVFTRKSTMPVSAMELYTWHTRPGAFERLVPPFESISVEHAPQLREKEKVVLALKLGPVTRIWIGQIADVIPGKSFRDELLSGPMASWNHHHLFRDTGSGTSILEDRVEYTLPFGTFGRTLGSSIARNKLFQVFEYRHAVLSRDLQLHKRAAMPPSRFLISGSSGLIGSALIPFLRSGGHTVVRLVRSRSQAKAKDAIYWNPEKGFPQGTSELEGFDGVIHLGGEGIADKRWSAQRKQRIRDSRVNGTRVLCEALSSLSAKPSVIVTASAVGIYGDTADEFVDESSPIGSGFLAEVGSQWEEATASAKDAGFRVVHARFGIVLSPLGGALKKMLLPFQMNMGGKLGNGRQYMSWVAMDDVIGAIHHALSHDQISGAMNVTAPAPVTNSEFTKTLAYVLGRFVGPPVPAFALRTMFGELADAALLSGTRVLPAVLQSSNYEFAFPDLEGALRHLLGQRRT